MKKNTLYILLIMLLATVNTAWAQDEVIEVSNWSELKPAINYAIDGQTIRLKAGITLEENLFPVNIDSEKAFTLDINGQELNADNHTITLKPGATCYYINGYLDDEQLMINPISDAEDLFAPDDAANTAIRYNIINDSYTAGNVTYQYGIATLNIALNWMDPGEEIILLQNIIITEDITTLLPVSYDPEYPDAVIGDTYTLTCGNYTLASDGSHHIQLSEGAIIISDKKLEGVFVADDLEHVTITETQDGSNWVYTAVANTPSPSTGVAKIGETEYATLEAAFADANDGEEIELMNNISLTDRLFINAGASPSYAGTNNRYATTTENKSITLDLKGYNITTSSNIALAGGSLNITNTGDADATHGVITTTGDGLAPIEVRGTGDLNEGRTLTIGTGVTLSGDQYGLNVFGSNDAQKNIIDVNVNGTVNGILFVLGNLTNDANEINIVVNGKVDATNAATGEKPKTGIALNGYANVTVNSGASVTGDTGIEARAGNLTVNGGTINATASTYSYAPNGSGTTTKGAAIAVAQHTTDKPLNVQLNGGTLEGTELIAVTDVNENGLAGVTVKAAASFVENTATSLPANKAWEGPDGDGNYTIVTTTPNTNVAKIGVTEYATLEAALADATNGQTIELMNNVSLENRLFVNAGASPEYAGTGNRYATTTDNKSITLDLKGYNITSSSNIALAGGSLNITNTGTADATHGVITTTGDGLAPIEVRGTGDLNEGRTLTIGTGVTLSGDQYGLNVFGSNDAQKNIIDVNVNGTVNGILFVLGNLTNDANEINIVVNGKVDATNAATGEKPKTGIALQGNANVTVNDNAEVTGDTGIEVRAGNLIVNGGTITGATDSYSYTANGSGTTTKGAAVAVAQHTTVKPINVQLNGGTLVGKELIGVTDVNENGLTGVTLKAAASFVENTETSLPEGYCWKSNGEQQPTYSIALAEAQIGTKLYTFADAVKAATTGQTVKLLRNITLTDKQLINKAINIDGNGKTISSNVADPTIGYLNNTACLHYYHNDDEGSDVSGSTLEIKNLTMQGFAYGINVEGNDNVVGATFNIENCTFNGRALINNWGDSNTFNVKDCTVNGINNESAGNDNDFACLVDNYMAENNTYNLEDVTVSATSTAANQAMLALRGTDGAVVIKGSTTFVGDPTSLCGFIEDETDLGSIFFDADAKGNTNPGNFNSILNQMLKEISNDAVASGTFAGLYPIGDMTDMPVVEISGVYFWSVEDAFESPQFVDGAELIFKKNATLSGNITPNLTNGTFTMTMDGHKLTAGDYHINLQSDVTAKTDVQVQAFGSNESDKVVKETKTNDGYEYSLMSEGSAIAKIGNNNFTSLKDALEAVNDGETITLVNNETSFNENFTLTLTDEAGAGKHQDGQFTIDLNGKNISGNGRILLPLKYTVNTNVQKPNLFDSAVDGMTVSETTVNDNLYAYSLELVARIGDVYFTSINAAVEAAQEGDKIIVIKGLEEDKPITINQTVVINKGITLEGENNQPFYLKLANDYSQKSAFRIVGSTTGDIFFNKMNLKTEIDGYVDNDPASQTYGKFITRATSGGAADGNAMGVVVDQYYSGSLTFNDGELCTDNRAINVVSIGKGFELNLNGTTITTEATKYKRDGIADNDDFDTSTMYINENMDTGEGRAINFSNDAVNATVNITNSTIEGFAYALNIAENSGNLKVNMKYGTIYARAPFNNWGDYSQFKIENVIVNGMNIEDENPNNINIHESYAAFCDNESANFNIYDIKDVTVKASVVGDAYNGSEMFINLRGNDAKVHILGGTTYEGEAMPKGGFTDSYTDNVKQTSDLENMIDNNYVWFDDDTKVFFTPLIEAHDIVSIADAKDNTQFYPLIRKPTYAIRLQKTIIDENAVNEEDKFIVTNYYFNTLEDAIKSENFESSVILTLLQDNVPLNEDITPNLEDGEYFTLRLKDDNDVQHSFVGNDHHILLNPGVSVNYDVACQELFDVADKELTVLLTEVPGEYVAGNVTYTWKDNENNITTSNGLFSDLFDLEQLENGSVVTLKKDITLADTYTIEYKTDGFQNGDSFTINFGDFDITPGENSIALPNGFTVHTDKETYMFSTVDPAMNIIETIDANGYHYTPGAAVAKIDRKYYTTIEAAFAAVPTDGTETKVELLVDLENNQEVTIPSGTNIIFDLGGHTYTTNATNGFNFADDEKTSLTVQNGEIDANSSNAAIRVAGKGNKLTIASDATVKNDGSNAKESIIAVMGNPSTDAADKNVVNIYGKLLTETAKVYGIAANGSRTTNTDINVYDGSEVTSTNDIAIFLPGGATVTTNIEGGTITGTTGIYAKSGVLNINGGTINGTGAQTDYTYVGNSAVATGDGLVIDNCGYPGGTPVVTVAGGDFNSTNAEPIASYGKDDSFEPVKKFVYGGTFNKQINAEYPAEGYYCPTTTNEDNRYYITTGVYEAKIGNKGYETFKKAVDAAGDDLATTIIELLSDVKVPYTMSNPEEILKVKLNGKKLTVNPPSSEYEVVTATDDDGVTTYSIKKSINKVDIAIKTAPTTYTGQEYKPTVIITDVVNNETVTLVEGTDYTFTYDHNYKYKDAKTYSDAITITGKGNYAGTRTIDYIVLPRDIADCQVSGNTADFRPAGYSAAQIAEMIAVKYESIVIGTENEETPTKFTYTLKKKGTTLLDGEKPDYKVEVDFTGLETVTRDNVEYIYNIGVYEDIITLTALEGADGTQNFVGNRTVDFTILPKNAIDISKDCVVTSDAIYTSTALPPTKERIHVIYKDPQTGAEKELTANDYDLEVHGTDETYIDAQTYSNAITIIGKINTDQTYTGPYYYGSFVADYVIAPRDLADAVVTVTKVNDMNWSDSDNDLSDNIVINGTDATTNNINLFMEPATGIHYNLQNKDAVVGENPAPAVYDYSYTVEPSPMKDPGEYKVIFTGRGNFTGMTEVKIAVLKNISAADAEIALQVIPGVNETNYTSGSGLTADNLKDVIITDGDATLSNGTHYTITLSTDPIKQEGKYTATITGKAPYYKGEKTVDFPAIYEYYTYAATNVDGNKFGIHVTSGKDKTANVGAIDHKANPSTQGLIINPTKNVTLTGVTEPVALTIAGIDDNAFNGGNALHYVDASQLDGYEPSSLSRNADGPFNGISKQAIVYLDGDDVIGENYVYETAAGDFRCDEFKIYDDFDGNQKGFDGEGQGSHTWEIINIHEFTAKTLTNTRYFNAGQHYTTLLPYDLPLPETLKAYNLTAASDGIFGFREIEENALTSFMPYVLIPSAAGNLLSTTDAVVKVTATANRGFYPLREGLHRQTTEIAKSGYVLYGSMIYMGSSSTNPVIEGTYIMQSGNQWKKVAPNSTYDGACILPMRAYILNLNDGINGHSREFMSAKFIDGVKEMTTDMVGDDWSNAEVYDLQGRKVDTTKSSMRKGVYIVNGQKRIRK